MILIIVSLTPNIVAANTDGCVDDGHSVIYVNGILTNKAAAEQNLEVIEDALKSSKYSKDITTYLGHNPTRGNIIDTSKSTLQSYFLEDKYQSLDLDATNILKNVHSDIKTKKILLLGHSQGTFYTNQLYHYLINNGVNEESIAVYNIGTPASYVSGDGKYITNSADSVINSVRLLIGIRGANSPLPPNVNIPISEGSNGHSLQTVYLAGEGERIVREIDALLISLKAPKSNNMDGCFNKPDMSLQAKIEQSFVNLPKNTNDKLVEIKKATAVLARSTGEFITNQVFKMITWSGKGITPRYEQDEAGVKATTILESEQTAKLRQLSEISVSKIKKQRHTIPIEAVQPTIDREQMGQLLAQLQIMLKGHLASLQPKDKCAGIDLSILKYSTCIPPFEEGGFAFGGGGGGGGVSEVEAPSECIPTPMNGWCGDGPPGGPGEWTFN